MKIDIFEYILLGSAVAGGVGLLLTGLALFRFVFVMPWWVS